MTRVTGLSKRNSLLTALAFAWSERHYGKILQPLSILAMDSKLLIAFGHVEWAQQRAGKLPKEIKLLARSLVAMQANCPWCLDFGMLESKTLGIPQEKMHALLEYQHSPLFTPEEVVVLRYAEAMTQTPVQVSDQLFDSLKEFYTETQILELTFLIAWENCVARFNLALDIKADEVSGDSFCLLPDKRLST